jgi:anti-sigma regulatory factor (Ser/Thr protein kinase)
MDDRKLFIYFPPRGRLRHDREGRRTGILSCMTRIEIPTRFGPEESQGWIRTWSSAQELPGLRVCLPPDARLEPGGIVLLAAGIARRQSRGLKTWIAADGGSEALALLHGVDFFRELGVEVEGAPPPTASPRWVALRRLVDLGVSHRQAQATRELLERFVPPIPASTIRAAEFVFEELAANVVQHSRAAETGFGLAVVDPATRRIQIAFADAGIGFLESLQSNPELEGRVAGHAQALRLALDKRVSRGGTGNIGMGLFLLSTLADRLQGNLSIATGDALLVRRAEGEARTEEIVRTAGWNGAWLCLDAPVPGW